MPATTALQRASREYLDAHAALSSHSEGGPSCSERLTRFHRAWSNLEDTKRLFGLATTRATKAKTQGAVS